MKVICLFLIRFYFLFHFSNIFSNINENIYIESDTFKIVSIYKILLIVYFKKNSEKDERKL